VSADGPDVVTHHSGPAAGRARGRQPDHERAPHTPRRPAHDEAAPVARRRFPSRDPRPDAAPAYRPVAAFSAMTVATAAALSSWRKCLPGTIVIDGSPDASSIFQPNLRSESIGSWPPHAMRTG